MVEGAGSFRYVIPKGRCGNPLSEKAAGGLLSLWSCRYHQEEEKNVYAR